MSDEDRRGTAEAAEVATQLHRLAEATETSLVPGATDAYTRSNLRALAGVLRNLATQLTGPPPADEQPLQAALAAGDAATVVREARVVAAAAVARTHPIDWVAVSGGR